MFAATNPSVLCSSSHGLPHGVDLATRQSEVVQEFFDRLLGWTFAPRPSLTLVSDAVSSLDRAIDGREPPPPPSYVVARCGEEVVAEFVSEPDIVEGDGRASIWSPQIEVDDLALALAQVEGAGGTVVEAPKSRGGDAWVATVTDSGGAPLCLWQSHAEDQATEEKTRMGSLAWLELETTSTSQASLFYSRVLGWEPERVSGYDGDTSVLFKRDGRPVAGAIDSPLPELADSWCPSFAVTNVDALVDAAVRLGAVVLAEPEDTVVGRQAYVVDPTGGICGLIGPRFAGFRPL